MDQYIDTINGQELSVVVGAGFDDYDPTGTSFGGDSSVSYIGYFAGYLCYAEGGRTTVEFNKYGRGGSGGGAGIYIDTDVKDLPFMTPGNGGSDGSNGEYSVHNYSENTAGHLVDAFGWGQGTTTRYFGESTGTLYAGGGGGIVSYWYWVDKDYKIGFGGAGGGGNALSPGAINTGGGGGSNGGPGGSGVCIIRWGE